MKIDEIKNKILQLAIQGKLVPQDENDEPASVLLEKIRAEKEQLIKEKKIKKEKALPEIGEEEKVFEIPEGWEWCRIIDISAPEMYSFVDGPFGSNLKREHYVDEGIRIIQLQNIGQGFWKDENKIYTTEEKANELIRCNAFPGDLVIAKMNPIARTTIIPHNNGRYVLCSDCVKLKPEAHINTYYIQYLMNSRYIRERADEDGTGTTRQRTSLGKLKAMPIPLPPIAEQKRIVSKVDELFAIVDVLGENKEAMEKAISDTRNKVLQLAIQGKLVEQNSEDEPASVLLEKIREEKEKLIKEKRIKKEKALPEIGEEEKAFEIPEGWEWCRLREIVYNSGQKIPNQEFCYIDVASIDNKRNQLGIEDKIIAPENAPSRARKIVNYGDVIYSTVRPYLHNICVIDRNFEKEAIVSTAFAVMTTCRGVSNRYLFRYLLSETFDNYVNNSGNSKGVAYPAITEEKLYSAVIALPPLEEQKRIVAKVDEVMKYLDYLEQALLA